MHHEHTEPRCAACKAQVFYTAIRVCHSCGYVHCVRCDGIGGNVSDACVRCGSPDVTNIKGASDRS